jgi:mRNA-degrading endonuclease RelE of RelBE toxin-antitoxin system
MADYAISFARSARKELERLSGEVAERILAKIETLAGSATGRRHQTSRAEKSLADARRRLSRGLFD